MSLNIYVTKCWKTESELAELTSYIQKELDSCLSLLPQEQTYS